MIDEQARADLALIRAAIDEGRGCATRCGPGTLVWGVAVALGYLGAYARVAGWWSLDTRWLWLACIGLPWQYATFRAIVRQRLRAAALLAPADVAPALSGR